MSFAQKSITLFLRRLSYLALNACFKSFKLNLIIPISNRLKREIDQNRSIYESLKYFKIF